MRWLNHKGLSVAGLVMVLVLLLIALPDYSRKVSPSGKAVPDPKILNVISGIINQSGKQIEAGAYDSAISTCRTGLPLCDLTPAGRLKKSTLYNYIGASFQFKSDFDSAAHYFYLAAHMAESVDNGSLQLMRVYNNLSLTFNSARENDKALFYLEEAEKLAKANKLHGLLPAMLLNKARIYKEQGKYAASEQTFETALQLSKTTEGIERLTGVSATVTQLNVMTNLGQLYITQKKWTKAKALLERALPLSADANPYYQVPVMLALGKLYFEQKDYKPAEEQMLQAIRKSESSDINDGLSEGHRYLAEIYHAQHRPEEAYRHLAKAFEIEEKIRGDIRTKDARLLEVKYRTAKKDKELAEKKLAMVQQDRLLKSKNIWIAGISFSILLLVILFVNIHRSYRHRQHLQEQRILAIEQGRHIELLQATAEGEEKERNRIAGNLHDGIGSIISAAKMNFSTLHTRESDREIFNRSMNLLNDAAFELRTTAHNLMPQMLLQEGLIAATRDFCERVSNGQSLHIEYHAFGDLTYQNKNFELFVYRMIQELVNNIIKHSGAGKALIQLSMENDLLAITVEDNGTGFNTDDLEKTQGSGLNRLRGKVSMYYGRLSIESSREAGTQVYAEFDLLNNNRDGLSND